MVSPFIFWCFFGVKGVDKVKRVEQVDIFNDVSLIPRVRKDGIFEPVCFLNYVIAQRYYKAI